MRLLYFKEKNYTPDELKKRRNDLAKLFHPDVNKNSNAHEKMKAINDEYEYVKKNALEAIKQAPVEEKKRSPNSIFYYRAAQNLFHALTNANGVDYNLLLKTIKSIPNDEFKSISVIYFNVYGFKLIEHINKMVKDKKTKELITLTIKGATGDLDIFELFSYFHLNSFI